MNVDASRYPNEAEAGSVFLLEQGSNYFMYYTGMDY
jgi:hypothetical protein